jgi:hypothetical protein
VTGSQGHQKNKQKAIPASAFRPKTLEEIHALRGITMATKKPLIEAAFSAATLCLLAGDFQVEFAGFLDEADQGLDGLAHGELSFDIRRCTASRERRASQHRSFRVNH